MLDPVQWPILVKRIMPDEDGAPTFAMKARTLTLATRPWRKAVKNSSAGAATRDETRNITRRALSEFAHSGVPRPPVFWRNRARSRSKHRSLRTFRPSSSMDAR